MRLICRSLSVALLAVFGAILLALSWTTTTAVQLQAAQNVTALIMGGTGHPLGGPKDPPGFVIPYLNNAVNAYINPAQAAGLGTNGPVDNAVAVVTPEDFWPVFGQKTFGTSVAEGRANLGNCLNVSNCDFNHDVGSDDPAVGDAFIVFGYSQSAVVASLAKRDLIAEGGGDPTPFFMIANPMRGNGGIMMRGKGIPTIPFLNIPFYGASPTDGPVNDGGTPGDPTDDTFVYPTIDVAQQYDALGGDFPYRPLNILALVNSLMGYAYLHGNVVNRPLADARYQGQMGDTTYYLFPTETLPILIPLQQIGVPEPILKLFDAPLRVLMEDAYKRDVNPGVPTVASLLPIGNPITLVVNLIKSIPVAIDDALQAAGLGRPLGTTAAGPFGVGGLSLPDPPDATASVSMLSGPAPAVEHKSAESVAPEHQSLTGEEAEGAPGTGDTKPQAEPEPEPVAGNDEETVAAESESATKPVEKLASATLTEAHPTPRGTHPHLPKVRGPIEFDPPHRPTESSSPSTAHQPATGETGENEPGAADANDGEESTGAAHQDAA